MCADCRPPGAAHPAPATIELMAALADGDWAIADAQRARGPAARPAGWSRRTCSGTWSAALRSLPLVDRGEDSVTPGRPVRPPSPHPSGARPPALPQEALPRHVAIIMDGNGRWAKQRGLPRTKGHGRARHALFDMIEGALELGIQYLSSAYAFSTENWKRSPDEVRFLMNFNRDIIRRRRDELHELGIRVRVGGPPARLWKSVINELRVAEEMTQHNSTADAQFCVNYGGQAEIADAAGGDCAPRSPPAGCAPSRWTRSCSPGTSTSRDLPDVDLFLRPSGEQRTSNFLIWQSVYAELVYPGHALAGLRSAASLVRLRAVRQARPPVRGGVVTGSGAGARTAARRLDRGARAGPCPGRGTGRCQR